MRYCAALIVAATLCGSVARAQTETVKPYVLLLFDTSGSMRERVCGGYISGDNSAECPGDDVDCDDCDSVGCDNGQADDIRLYKVKKGATSVVGAFGEVIFGLARFHQTGRDFACDVGGWRGAPGDNDNSQDENCDGDAVGTGWTSADILVPFADGSQNEILLWMNNCDDYPTVGDCPWAVNPEDANPNGTPDKCSLCPECDDACDKELRATGWTPLAGSLRHFRTNFFPGVIAADDKSACRPYKVIMLTDGQDTCPGNPGDEAEDLFKWSQKSIPVHVIGFGDSSLKTGLDTIASKGGTNEAVIVEDETSLALAMAAIISESLLSEKCNNADDDCDGICDESFPEVAVSNPDCSNDGRAAKTCTAGIGICVRVGDFVCLPDESGSSCSVTPGPPNPGGEICGNQLDDDCDGQIDEGCVPCISQPEICDGKDNDCDGDVDEGYVPVPCGSDIGACAAGSTACVNGQVVCNGAAPPTVELCDNIDNNCDTLVDFFTAACYPANTVGCDVSTGVCQGLCTLGANLCTNGSWGPCLNFVGPSTEVCNQLDDDCDQNPDDGAVCSQVPYCYSSTLENASAVSSGGFSLRGGSFVDGGLQIDAPGTRVERSLGGNFYQGKVSFEARGLHWQKPLASGANGCLRTVFDLNHNDSGVADHARMFLASMAPGCGGNDDGVLRTSMHSAFCCLDSAALPASDDNLWHSYALRWTAATVSLEIDSAVVVQTDYRGPSVGQNPLFWFGSAGGSGDASGAVFRNLEVCNQP